jgi:hypothetical protein
MLETVLKRFEEPRWSVPVGPGVWAPRCIFSGPTITRLNPKPAWSARLPHN